MRAEKEGLLLDTLTREGLSEILRVKVSPEGREGAGHAGAREQC